MRYLALAASVLCITAIAPDIVLAEEQSGSAGGAIGKQGRSASGSEAVENQRNAPARAPSGAARQSETGGSSCAKVVGVWKGPLDFSTFKSNGTVTSPSFPTEGPWTCRNGQLVIAWKDWGIDRCSLSADGLQMNCKNETLGNTFSRIRTGSK